MASYAGLSDVQGLIAKFTLDANSKPTATQAGVVIDGISAEIDSVLAGAGYTVPVTTPSHFVAWLKLLNQFGAASAIIRSIFADKTGGSDTGGEGGIEAYYAARYKDGLASLRNGSIIPPGLTSNAGYVAPSTYFTRNPDEDEDLGVIAEPFFKRSKVF